jgi:DNA-binding SARP family transcriptional activator
LLLACLLLHRSRPVSRDTLGGVFWPDTALDIVRDRLHVALYGLRRDLRTLHSQHPIACRSPDQLGLITLSGIVVALSLPGLAGKAECRR